LSLLILDQRAEGVSLYGSILLLIAVKKKGDS